MNPRLITPARLSRSILRTQSDQRLAELAAAGSDPAFEALVARHRRALVAQCARFVGATDAEEAAQDALLRALAALRRGDRVDRLAPWLHVVARRVALNMRRAQVARGECALPETLEGTGDDEAAARARLHEVVAAVEALPARQREAIVMRELEGRSYVEIAERMGSSPSAVRQLLHRARAGLRQRVAGVLAWEPLVRWASSLGWGSGSRVGAIADSCAATAKLCAALVAVGAGGVSALEASRPARTPRARQMRTATAVPAVGHRSAVAAVGHRSAVAAVGHRSAVAVTRTPSPATTTTSTASSVPTSTTTTHVSAPAATHYVAEARATHPVVLVSRTVPTPTTTTTTRSTDTATQSPQRSEPSRPSQPAQLRESARQPAPSTQPRNDMPDSPPRGEARPSDRPDTLAPGTGGGSGPR